MDNRDGEASPTLPVTSGAAACRNCGAHAPGHYCGNCGQETRVTLPTFAAFMREAAGRYVSFDGRFWRTMAALVARPGFLTQEYLRGRRKRYIRPARLFLVLYLVLFGVIGLVQSPSRFSDEVVFVDADRVGKSAAAGAASTDAATPAPGKGADASPPDAASPDPIPAEGPIADEATAMFRNGDGSTFFGIDKDMNLTLRLDNHDLYVPPQVRKRWEEFKKLPQQEKAERVYAGMLRYGPYAMVALLPAFALLLKLAYLGRGRTYPQRPQRYAEHLVYSAHLHAFAAVMLLALLLVPFGIVKLAIAAWVLFYAMRARQRVYGGRWWAGMLRAFGVGAIYLVVLSLAMAGLVVVAVMLR